MAGDENQPIPAAAQNNAVALKLPTFWTHQPRVWFAQAEAQFRLREITVDDTKYSYLLAALPEEVAVRALDFIESMAHSESGSKYEDLKSRLLGTFTPSDYERAGMLINGPDLGDDKPSVLMDKMLALLGNHEPCLFFKRLFLDRLPAGIRAPLLHSEEKDMRKLAEKADLMWQALKGSQGTLTGAVSMPDPTETNVVSRGRGNSSTGNSFQAWRKEWQQVPKGPCAYHSYYGSKARSCTPPCLATHPGNPSASHQ